MQPPSVKHRAPAISRGQPIRSSTSSTTSDCLRPNAHWHAIVLEGGFSPDGRFLFLPIHDTPKLTEAFRCAIIKLLLSKSLITEESASALLCWKNSGFSVNNRVRIHSDDHKTRVALAQYEWS